MLNPYRYTAKRLDAISGTLDMGARRFGPDTARFLQRDRYLGALSDLRLSLDPLTGNRYSLAGGNLLSFIETDGHVFASDQEGGGCTDVSACLGPSTSPAPRNLIEGLISGLKGVLRQGSYGLASGSGAAGDWLAENAGPVLRQGVYDLADWWGRTEADLNSTDPARQWSALANIAFAAVTIAPAPALRTGQVALAGAARARWLKTEFSFGELGGALGTTDRFGNITIQRGLTGSVLEETVRPESIHARLSSTNPAIAGIQTWLYRNSQVAKFAEEALAETYATRSFARGLQMSFASDTYNLTYTGVAREVAGALTVSGFVWRFASGDNAR